MARTRTPVDGLASAVTWLLSVLGALSALASSRHDEGFPHDPLLDQRAP